MQPHGLQVVRFEHDALKPSSSFPVDEREVSSSAIPSDFGARNGTEIRNKEEILYQVDAVLGTNRPPDLEYIWVMPFAMIRIPFTDYGIGYNAYGHSAVRYRNPKTDEQVVMNIVGKSGGAMTQFHTPADYFFGLSDPTTRINNIADNKNQTCVNQDPVNQHYQLVPNSCISPSPPISTSQIEATSASPSSLTDPSSTVSASLPSPLSRGFPLITQAAGQQLGIYNRQMFGVRVEHLSDSRLQAMHEYAFDIDQLYPDIIK